MISWFKRIWQKMFGLKTGSFDTIQVEEVGKFTELEEPRPAYDPAEDPMRIMTGEIESYFD